MTVTALPLAEHPAFAALAAVESALADGDLTVYAGLSVDDAIQVASRWARVQAQVSAHATAATRAVDRSGAAKQAGATSTGSLLASQFGGDRYAAARDVHLGQDLARAGLTENALARGGVTKEQARLIARTITRLPDEVPGATREKCEQALIEDAATLTMRDLQHRADRITDVFKPAPEVDADEDQIVRHREQDAYARSEFWMQDTCDGTWTGGFRIPEAQAGLLKHALDRFTAPRRRHLDDGQAADDLTYSQRHGRAFVSLVEHLPTDGLPDAGGSGLVVTVNVDLDTLTSGTGIGTTSTGQRMSAGEVRRAACRAGIIPWSSAERPSRSTSAAPSACSTGPSAWPWPTETKGARSPTATAHRPGPRPTTHANPGHTAARRTSTTGCCSVRSTIAPSTTTAGPSPSTPTTDAPRSSHPPGSTRTDDPAPARGTGPGGTEVRGPAAAPARVRARRA